MHAKAREEQDTLLNEKKSDRVAVTGMTARRAFPSTAKKDKWREWFKQEVVDALIWMNENVVSMISFVNVVGKWISGRVVNVGEDIPNAEVQFHLKETAMVIRKAFVEGRKAGKVTGKLYITNYVTLATRVRAEIMWAIANQFATEKGQMYVTIYVTTVPV